VALELGPYGADRQQRAVELALRDVQDLLAAEEPGELELAASRLQEALFGLNRRLMSEKRAESGPLQGLRNTLGSLKDELFSDDDWDDWERGGQPYGRDPWDSDRVERSPYERDPYEREPYGTDPYERSPMPSDPYRDERGDRYSLSERGVRRRRAADLDDPWADG
jgi:molecular chaperone DnaK